MSSPAPHPARWSAPLADGRLLCTLCPRACKVAPGQRAFCFVRMNDGGRMVLDTYGRSTGFCLDPIEKKPLHHFLPGTAVLSFGTAGCNLGCRFCQNWDISKSRDVARASQTATPAAVAEAARAAGAASVAFTYNDPVIWAEYALDTARECRARGVRTVAVTAGYITAAARAEFFAGMDAANIDLKAFSEAFYQRLAFGALAPVLDTLEYVARETAVWLEVTTLLIPGANDDEDELRRAADWYVARLGPEVPWHFTAFHPDFKVRDRPRTPAATLFRAREIARAAGVRHVYTGNITDAWGQSTTCSGCGAVLIERRGYEIGSFRLDSEGCCRACGHPLAGRFAARPGAWGARRVPVQV